MEYKTPCVTESNTQSTARVKWPRFTLIKEFVERTLEFKSMNSDLCRELLSLLSTMMESREK